VVEYKRPKCEGKLLSSFECIWWFVKRGDADSASRFVT
jgi:hypothetical protein